MTNENTTCVVQAGRSAWPRVFGIMLSCGIATLVVASTTAAYAQMGENLTTTRLELTTDDTVQRSCNLGDACGDDSALSGNFGGVWRNATFVEPDPRSFPGILFVGKVISAVESGIPFDVYCSTESEDEACVRLQATETDDGDGGGLCQGIIDVQPSANDCPGFDYKVEYGKNTNTVNTVLKLCNANVVSTCLADDSALVTNGKIVAYRALFDYDCVRYCYGGCCRF